MKDCTTVYTVSESSLFYDWTMRCGPTCFDLLRIYLLTAWNRALLEKLTGSAASQEITRTFGTRMFITIFTNARQLSLCWANSIQFPQPPPTSWRSILILTSHLRLGLPSGLLFSTENICVGITQYTVKYGFSTLLMVMVQVFRVLTLTNRVIDWKAFRRNVPPLSSLVKKAYNLIQEVSGSTPGKVIAYLFNIIYSTISPHKWKNNAPTTDDFSILSNS